MEPNGDLAKKKKTAYALIERTHISDELASFLFQAYLVPYCDFFSPNFFPVQRLVFRFLNCHALLKRVLLLFL